MHLVDEDVSHVLEGIVLLKALQQDPRGAEEEAGVRGCLGLEADRVPHRLSDGVTPLRGDSLGDGHGRYPAGLRHDNVARHAPRGGVLEAVLRHLRRLAGAGLSLHDSDAVGRDGLEESLPVPEDGQAAALRAHRAHVVPPVAHLRGWAEVWWGAAHPAARPLLARVAPRGGAVSVCVAVVVVVAVDDGVLLEGVPDDAVCLARQTDVAGLVPAGGALAAASRLHACASTARVDAHLGHGRDDPRRVGDEPPEAPVAGGGEVGLALAVLREGDLAANAGPAGGADVLVLPEGHGLPLDLAAAAAAETSAATADSTASTASAAEAFNHRRTSRRVQHRRGARVLGAPSSPASSSSAAEASSSPASTSSAFLAAALASFLALAVHQPPVLVVAIVEGDSVPVGLYPRLTLLLSLRVHGSISYCGREGRRSRQHCDEKKFSLGGGERVRVRLTVPERN